MKLTLQDHPFWRTLDRSTQRLLLDGLVPLQWSGRTDLQRLGDGALVIGYVDGAGAITANAACLAASTEPTGALPDAPGHGWRIAVGVLAPLLDGQETSQQHLLQACATPCLAADAAQQTSSDISTDPFSLSVAMGWLMVIAPPLATALVLGGTSGVSTQVSQWIFFMAALASGLCVWIFNLAPPFVGALLALLLMVVSGSNLPSELAFAGLSSGNFYLLLGMLGVSAAVQQSGLIERMLGAVLRVLPHGPRTVQASVLVTGVLMSVFIPSTSGRLQLVVPMVRSFAKPGQRAALAFAALSGCTLFSTVFLMGNAGNFIVLGILPEHWQAHVNWTMWFKGAGVYALVLALLLAASVLWQRADAPASTATTATPRRPFSAHEAIVALALLCLTLGMGLGNVHHIATPWLTLFVFLLLVACGVLSLHRLPSDIHWPILIYLVCTVGFARGFAFTGLDEWIGSHLGVLTSVMRSAQVHFLWLLIGIVLLLRLLLPTVVCVTTLCAVLMPLADTFGLNPWVIGFIVLTASEAWFFAHQSTDYLLFRESTGLLAAESRQLLRANGRIQGCRVLALGLSIPYWQYLGYVQ